ncbi:MAG: hypothetical protein ABH826_03700 [Patescibacteria group bacterium]|nr:hypothetical protein [Patescibacteria group bacterium]
MNEMMPRGVESFSPQEEEERAHKQEELNTVYETAVRYEDRETIDAVKAEMKEYGFDVPRTSHEGYSAREAQQINALQEAVAMAEERDLALADELREKLRAAMQPVQEDRVSPVTRVEPQPVERRKAA